VFICATDAAVRLVTAAREARAPTLARWLADLPDGELRAVDVATHALERLVADRTAG
jgi:hypothetical protein